MKENFYPIVQSAWQILSTLIQAVVRDAQVTWGCAVLLWEVVLASAAVDNPQANTNNSVQFHGMKSTVFASIGCLH